MILPLHYLYLQTRCFSQTAKCRSRLASYQSSTTSLRLSSSCCWIDLWDWKHHQAYPVFLCCFLCSRSRCKKIKILNFFVLLVSLYLHFKKKSFIMKLYFSLALLQMNTRVALLHDIPSSGSFWPIPLTVQFGTKHTQQDPDSHFTLTIPQLDRKSTGSLDHPGYRVISFPCRLFHTNKTNSVNAELPIIANDVAVLVTLQRTAFCQ